MLSRWRNSYTQARDRDDLHTLLYTPTLSVTPRVLSKELVALGQYLSVSKAGTLRSRPISGSRVSRRTRGHCARRQPSSAGVYLPGPRNCGMLWPARIHEVSRRSGPRRSGSRRSGSRGSGPRRPGPRRSGPAGQARVDQVRAGQVRAGQVRAGQVRAARSAPVRSAPARFAPVRSAPVRFAPGRFAPAGARRSGSRRAGSRGQGRAGQVHGLDVALCIPASYHGKKRGLDVGPGRSFRFPATGIWPPSFTEIGDTPGVKRLERG